jgi:hypothetical protein
VIFYDFLVYLGVLSGRLDTHESKFIGRASEKPLSFQLCQRALPIVVTSCGDGNTNF